jgi:hypothetical protein
MDGLQPWVDFIPIGLEASMSMKSVDEEKVEVKQGERGGDDDELSSVGSSMASPGWQRVLCHEQQMTCMTRLLDGRWAQEDGLCHGA